jgi:hypothetical protein
MAKLFELQMVNSLTSPFSCEIFTVMFMLDMNVFPKKRIHLQEKSNFTSFFDFFLISGWLLEHWLIDLISDIWLAFDLNETCTESSYPDPFGLTSTISLVLFASYVYPLPIV